MSAWSTALAMSPSAAASWLASISRSTSSGPTSAIAAIQASAEAGDREAEAALLACRPRRRAAGASWAQRAATRTPAARKKTAPSAGDLPEPVEGRRRPRRRASPRAAPRSARAAGRRRARQAAKPDPEQRADQAEDEQPADQRRARRRPPGRASGRRGPAGRSSAAAPRRTGRCRRRGRAPAFRRRRRSRPARSRGGRRRRGRRSAARGLVGELRCRSSRTGPRRGRRPRSRRAIASTAAASAIRFSTRRVAGELDRPAGAAPPSRRSSRAQAGEEQPAPARCRRAGSAARSTPWSTAAWLARLSARLSRACTASTAGSAPSAADRQRRQQPEAVAGEGEQAAGGDDQGQQAAARVGEVEGEQRPPASPRPRASAAPSSERCGSSRAASRRRSRTSPRWRSSSRAGSAAAAPLPSARRPRAHAGRRRLARPSRRDQRQRNCDAFSETLAPFVGLGDKESGKEEAEVDQNAVRLDHAQLNRPRPEG